MTSNSKTENRRRSIFPAATLKITTNDKTLAKDLQGVVWSGLWEDRLVFLILCAAFCVAVTSPSGISHFSFLGRLAICLGSATILMAFVLSLGCLIIAKLTTYKFSMQTSVFVMLFIFWLFYSAFLIFIFPLEFINSPLAILETYFETLSGQTLFSFATGYMFLKFKEVSFKSCFEKANLKIEIVKTQKLKNEPIQKLLPAHVRGTVLYMEAQDKYVHVTTMNGSYLLSMSLSKAIEHLTPDQGLRIHRSTWLNWNEMQSFIYVNGNPRVLCRNDRELPVSRRQLDAVKDYLEK